jgi:putative transposase
VAKSKHGEEKTTLEYGVILGISPNEKQKTQFRKTFGCSRWVYNYFLSIRRDTYKYLKESISYNLASSILTDVKKEYLFLREVDKFALQNALKHLDFAFERFFKRVKKRRNLFTLL